jgi:hypothetical protein
MPHCCQVRSTTRSTTRCSFTSSISTKQIAKRHKHDVIKTRRSKQCVHSARSHVTHWFTKDTCSATTRHYSLLKPVPSRRSNFGKFWVIHHMCVYVFMYACMYVCIYVYMYVRVYVCMYVCVNLVGSRTGLVVVVLSVRKIRRGM